MKTIQRNDPGLTGHYQIIISTESHHDHEIIEDDRGRYRWKENEDLRLFLESNPNFGLNEIVVFLYTLGYDKNSEVYRKLYRDLGYSLYGYWEVFYWEGNNPKSSEYVPKVEAEHVK